MKTTAKIIAIGNSKGVRLPKKLLDESGLSGEVEIESRGNELVIMPVRGPHEGWEESAKMLRQRGGDDLLLGDLPASTWDETAWKW